MLFILHARLRYSDGQNVVGPLRIEGDLLEAGVVKTKTSNRPGRRRRLLTVSACALGVSGLPWAQGWLEVREIMGIGVLSEGTPLMPRPLAGGAWGSQPLSAHFASVWLRRLLAKGAAPDESLDKVSTHSMKATLLSWLAKAGVDVHTRRLLGYHTTSQDEVVLLYSRDGMAAPLRELGSLLEGVSSGRMHPDEPRSRFWGARQGPPAAEEGEPTPDPPSASEASELGRAHLPVSQSSDEEGDPPCEMSDMDEGVTEQPWGADLAGSPSGDDLSSDAVDELEVAEEAALPGVKRRRLLTADSEGAARPAVPAGSSQGCPFIHALWGTVHLGTVPPSDRLACGRVRSEWYSPLIGPEGALARCSVCFGRGASAFPPKGHSVVLPEAS
jgi:hypothetical protein